MMPTIGVVDVDCGCTRAEEIWTSKRLLWAWSTACVMPFCVCVPGVPDVITVR